MTFGFGPISLTLCGPRPNLLAPMLTSVPDRITIVPRVLPCQCEPRAYRRWDVAGAGVAESSTSADLNAASIGHLARHECHTGQLWDKLWDDRCRMRWSRFSSTLKSSSLESQIKQLSHHLTATRGWEKRQAWLQSCRGQKGLLFRQTGKCCQRERRRGKFAKSSEPGLGCSAFG